MSTIKSENWDGVTAPAIPAGWTIEAPWATATAGAISAPNALVYPSSSSGAFAHANWATVDTNNGDVQVSVTVNLAAATSEQDFQLYARANAILTGANEATSSLYLIAISRVVGTGIFLRKKVNNVTTTIGSVATVPASATNYRIYLACQGTTLTGKVQRLSDSTWLNSSGVFVTDATGNTAFATGTDASLTGAGYAGFSAYLIDASAGTVTVDDFLLETNSPVVVVPTTAGGVTGNPNVTYRASDGIWRP